MRSTTRAAALLVLGMSVCGPASSQTYRCEAELVGSGGPSFTVLLTDIDPNAHTGNLYFGEEAFRSVQVATVDPLPAWGGYVMATGSYADTNARAVSMIVELDEPGRFPMKMQILRYGIRSSHGEQFEGSCTRVRTR